jgi:uncharacterized membrane protein YjgN (DUF898 family)
MKSRFTGNIWSLLGVYAITGALSICTLGIGAPWAICRAVRWTAEHTEIDGQRFYFDGKGGKYFGLSLLWLLPGLILAGLYFYNTFYVQDIALAGVLAGIYSAGSIIYPLWLTIRELKWFVKHIHMECNRPYVADQDAAVMDDMM